MPVITSIKPQKYQKRLKIYLDGKYGFSIDLKNFVKLKLKIEQNLSDAEVIAITKKSDLQSIYDKILKFGSLRPHSEKEYTDWFIKHKVSKSLYEELFNRLKNLNFINDEKFATWWIEQRKEFKQKSKIALTFELKNKGVEKSTIEKVLVASGVDELTTANKLLEKKSYIWNNMGAYEARIKKSQFLARKGFKWEIIRKVVDVDQNGEND